MRELFVYYRVQPSSIAPAREAVRSAQAGLRAAYPGLVARLLQRDDAADPSQPQTWMETYALPATARGIDAALQAAIEAAAAPLRGCIDGARHVEAFVERASSEDGAQRPSRCD